MQCPNSIRRELLKCVPVCILSQEQVIQLVRETGLTFAEVRYHTENFRYKVPPELRETVLTQTMTNPVIGEMVLRITDRDPIRGVNPLGKPYHFSVHDFIWNVSTHTNRQSVARVWAKLIADGSEFKDEVLALTTYMQFPGRWQRPTPCMDVRGLQRLLVLLGATVCEAYRRLAETTLAKMAEGDLSMVQQPSEAPVPSVENALAAAQFWKGQFHSKVLELEEQEKLLVAEIEEQKRQAAETLDEHKRQASEDRESMKEAHRTVIRLAEKLISS